VKIRPGAAALLFPFFHYIPPSFPSTNLLTLYWWSPITKERCQQSVIVTKAYQLTQAADFSDEMT